MYLSYDEYQTMGGALDETAFNNLEWEAQCQVDYWTFHRLSDESEYPEAVKRCIFKLIELIYEAQKARAIDVNSDSTETTTSAGVRSMSNDGVSVTYNLLDASTAVDIIKNDIRNCISRYLDGVQNSLGRYLLYRGLYPGE